ncbi:MAG: tRNA (adenosine(37)-N6)-dimethylallyltransferase MiaA, partial [Candidatus Omnitrophica bacterium]|nr:tRNA (adenosine(37)-N6)-dimethylallyltransferase MiaA [Candidatus Omnitrophota bacterium]
EYLYRKLEKIDPESAKKISSNDLRRVIRALEIYSLSGQTMSAKKKETSGLWDKLSIEIFGLRFKRNNLYQRINKRTDEMFEQGAVAEVRDLVAAKLSLTAKKMLGISEIEGFLNNDLSQEEAKEKLKKNTRNFAKRQVTWFKKDKRIQWIDMDELNVEQAVEDILRRSHE